jgi:hypothetical protein
MEDNEIEDRKLNSLARLASIKVLYRHKCYEVVMVADDPHSKRRHFEVVSPLLK